MAHPRHADVKGQGGFAGSAFLVEDCQDHQATLASSWINGKTAICRNEFAFTRLYFYTSFHNPIYRNPETPAHAARSRRPADRRHPHHRASCPGPRHGGRFRQASKADTTIRAYRADLCAFEDWCRSRGLQSCPASPDTVADHLAWCATHGRLSPSSIGRRTAAVRYGHKLAGFDPPTIQETVRAAIAGIRRTMGVAPKRKQPVTAERLGDMLKGLPDTLAGKRDRALLCLGLAGAFRRSELVALTVADLTEVPDGYRVLIRRSRPTRPARGRKSPSREGSGCGPWRPSRRGWRRLGSPRDRSSAGSPRGAWTGRGKPATELVGAEALTGHSVALAVKRHCRRAGLDPVEFSGHSLRSGYVTSQRSRRTHRS